jgi:hypothetical protein
MSRRFVDAFAPNHRRLRQIQCAQEHGLLLPNVIFAEMFLQAPLPDCLREGAAADPEPLNLKRGLEVFAFKALALKSLL